MVPSILLKYIHRCFKSMRIITIKPYLFGRLFDDSKQKTGYYKMIKIRKNRVIKKLYENPIHSQIGECLTPFAMAHCGSILFYNI